MFYQEIIMARGLAIILGCIMCVCFVDCNLTTTEPLQEITIATLLPFDENRLFAIKRVRPAIEIAMDKVNKNLEKKNKKLVMKFRDSNCQIADGMNEVINFYVEGHLSVVFGPCCDYAAAPVARQVKYWDIPMVTPGALAGEFGLGKAKVFTTLTRVGPNFNTLVTFLLDILYTFSWKKVNLIYDPEGQREISSRFCHIAVNDIHYGFRSQTRIPELWQDYKKFETHDEIIDNLQDYVGRDCAGDQALLGQQDIKLITKVIQTLMTYMYHANAAS